jgi:hypothetical protein
MIGIEQKPFQIIADFGATSSGINLLVVKELKPVGQHETHRVYLPDVVWEGREGLRWERWKFLCELGRLWLKRICLLCRLVLATTYCWVTS